ncbi:MAG TPA: type II toxin-antitoxin system RatA family toxin [Gammaproteobacteria bacterium]|nr:type II toxin-antitoxin system RatA family toxin [Gammaproteobacteria bacterium]
MTTINRNALVPYSPAQMFDLVNDVEAYPRFLPWCTGAQVLRRDEDEVQARLELAKGGMEKSFTTLNRLQKDKMIEMRLVEGPFRHLEGFWRFQSLGGQGCKVSLDLEFEFANKLLSLALGPMFTQIANTLVDSFCARAADVYG